MSERASLKFSGDDKFGTVWKIHQMEDDSESFNLFASSTETHLTRERPRAYVKTHKAPGQPLPKAYLTDVLVPNKWENRGIGSMLIREAIRECKRIGNKGIEGNLSSADKSRLDKLTHFYRKLGFSVCIFEPGTPKYDRGIFGEIEMIF